MSKIKMQFFVFIVSGCLTSIVDCTVVYLSLLLTENVNFAISLGFACGFVVNFILHTKFTFKQKFSVSSGWKLIVVVAINYILTLLLCRALMELLSLGVLFAKIMTLPAIAVIGFLLSRYWVFKSREQNEMRENYGI